MQFLWNVNSSYKYIELPTNKNNKKLKTYSILITEDHEYVEFLFNSVI